MTTLIHGDNVRQSVDRLSKLEAEFSGEITRIHTKGHDKNSLSEELNSSSLFSGSILYIIENPLIAKKFLQDVSFPPQQNLILFEDTLLSKQEIAFFQKLFPSLKIEEFKFDPVVFRFVEAIYPGNQKSLIPLWKAYIKTEEPEIAFSMIVRQSRLLLGAEEYEKLGDWQKRKVDQQKVRFPINEVIKFHKQLLDLEYKYKSGLTPLSLSDSLELLLFSL